MRDKREAGVLLHPTSFPSEYGIGDLGEGAYKFIVFLENAGQKLWQILPLNPPGWDASPYQSNSAFAVNDLLISIEGLKKEGLLVNKDIAYYPELNQKKIQFSKVKTLKERLLRKAFQSFIQKGENREFQYFKLQNSIWLKNYSLFNSLKKHFKGLPWNCWEKDIAFRKPAAIDYYQEFLKEEIEYNNFVQFKLFQQWHNLKRFAEKKEIRIIGDLPIFVSYDSSDVWSNNDLFFLQPDGSPKAVAGVPPDYFSKTGQLWGNPLYQWDIMENNGFRWWIERFKNLLKLVHIIRIDHFRGFEAFWEVPAEEKTAEKGVWKKGPGSKIFKAIEKEIGILPVIAEDLGFITPEVERLKNYLKFPGIKVLQFILEDKNKTISTPIDFETNSVMYTGTHDNDTIIGWYRKLVHKNSPVVGDIEKLLGISPVTCKYEVCWGFINAVLESSSKWAIIPLQDLLGLDSEARMNIPGTSKNNWEWRYSQDELSPDIIKRLYKLTVGSGRCL